MKLSHGYIPGATKSSFFAWASRMMPEHSGFRYLLNESQAGRLSRKSDWDASSDLGYVVPA